MSNHTPGPWRISGIQNNGAVLIRGPQLSSEIGLALQNDRSHSAMENALLMVASPMMYEFIKNLAKYGDVEAEKLLVSLSINGELND